MKFFLVILLLCGWPSGIRADSIDILGSPNIRVQGIASRRYILHSIWGSYFDKFAVTIDLPQISNDSGQNWYRIQAPPNENEYKKYINRICQLFGFRGITVSPKLTLIGISPSGFSKPTDGERAMTFSGDRSL